MATVLIIDDHEDSREALSRFLRKAGLTTRSAPNGRDALLQLAREVPDAIILDMMMPEMNGTEFLEIIHSYLRWSVVPVIVVTAYADGPHIDRARQLGVQNVYHKGEYRMEDLLKCLTGLLHNPHLHGIGGIGA